MNKIETLKDGTKVVVRPLSMDDLDRLMVFYTELPDKDRRYLRVDVTDRDVVKQRIKQTESGHFIRLIALDGERVAADGNLELPTEDWRKHQGELRVIVDRKYRHKGLGTVMLRELYYLAAQKKVEKVVVRVMRPQVAARKICHKLGFHEETVIPDYVRDLSGKTQDMIIMTCDMKEFWNELEHYYEASDWRRHR
jgi:RimJ/RimL family protein N-acetyltransferase